MRPETTQHPPPRAEPDLPGIVRRLLEIHVPEIHQVLRGLVMKSRVCCVDETSDLLGEVARQVIQKAEEYDRHRPFVPWVLGFVGYVLASRQRQRGKAQREVPLSQLAPSANEAFWDKLTSSQQADAEENRQKLGDWLGELDEEDRRVIELRYFHNYDGQELAEAIAAGSVGAARVRLCRALKRLRQIALRKEGGTA